MNQGGSDLDHSGPGWSRWRMWWSRVIQKGNREKIVERRIRLDYGGVPERSEVQLGWNGGGGACCVPGVTSAAEELDLSVLDWKCMGLLWVRTHPPPTTVTHTHTAPGLKSRDWKR